MAYIEIQYTKSMTMPSNKQNTWYEMTQNPPQHKGPKFIEKMSKYQLCENHHFNGFKNIKQKLGQEFFGEIGI